jgi:hypothetical protein
MSTRPQPEREYATVDEAVFCVARFSPDPDRPGKSLNLTQVAARMDGWSEQQLCDRTSGTKQRFGAEWIVPLTLATRNFAIVRTICRLVGLVAVPIPREGMRPADLLEGITSVSREYAEAMGALSACLDGATPREKLDAIRQLTDLIEKAAAQREQLQASVDSGRTR